MMVLTNKSLRREQAELLPDHWAEVIKNCLHDRIHSGGIYHKLSRQRFAEHVLVLLGHYEDTRETKERQAAVHEAFKGVV